MQKIVDDGLWSIIEPMLPPPNGKGRPPVGNREALTGILFVLLTGLAWRFLPREMGCGSGVTCWRRLRDWNDLGVWARLHQVLLSKLHCANKIDWSRAIADSSTVRSPGGETARDQVLLTAESSVASTMS